MHLVPLACIVVTHQASFETGPSGPEMGALPTTKINKVHLVVIYDMHTNLSSMECTVYSISCSIKYFLTRLHMCTYTTVKVAQMNSGGFKTHKCTKISKFPVFWLLFLFFLSKHHFTSYLLFLVVFSRHLKKVLITV